MSWLSTMSTTKKLAVLLAVSVGLNLFLLGMVVVGLARMPHGGAFGPPPTARPFAFRGDEPLGAEHPRLRKMLAGHEPGLLDQRRALQGARARVKAALEAEPFERARLEAELGNLRSETEHAQAAMHRALVEVASDMTPEERKRLPLSMRPRGRDGRR